MPTICLNANTLAYPTGGGHRWVYLNWAMGLRANGCRVIWMEGAAPAWGAVRTRELTTILKDQLLPYGFADSLAVYSFFDEPLHPGAELAPLRRAGDGARQMGRRPRRRPGCRQCRSPRQMRRQGLRVGAGGVHVRAGRPGEAFRASPFACASRGDGRGEISCEH